jgi:hypothetical protein
MKNNKKMVFIYLVSLLVGIVVCLLVCYFFGNYILAEPNSFLVQETISSERGASLYNAQTILSEIRNGEEDVFSDTKLDGYYKYLEDDVSNNLFTDEELFEITQYYFREKWNETPEDWRMVRVYYSLYDCAKGFDGPYSVDYEYEKKIQVEGKNYITVRNVGLAEWHDMLRWSEEIVDRSNLSGNVNWENINYHAMEIYDIAEENGGYEYHIESDNQCRKVIIALYGDNQSWNVTYYSQIVDSTILEMEINKKTGIIVE